MDGGREVRDEAELRIAWILGGSAAVQAASHTQRSNTEHRELAPAVSALPTVVVALEVTTADPPSL